MLPRQEKNSVKLDLNRQPIDNPANLNNNYQLNGPPPPEQNNNNFKYDNFLYNNNQKFINQINKSPPE